jgi:hypothetical protein
VFGAVRRLLLLTVVVAAVVGVGVAAAKNPRCTPLPDGSQSCSIVVRPDDTWLTLAVVLRPDLSPPDVDVFAAALAEANGSVITADPGRGRIDVLVPVWPPVTTTRSPTTSSTVPPRTTSPTTSSTVRPTTTRPTTTLPVTTTSTTTTIALDPNTVPASIAADCSVDVTADLATWITSRPDGVILRFGGCYRIDGTLELRGRSGLTFDGNGSTFRSVKSMVSGNAADGQRAMFRFIDSTGFVLRDMTITGAYTNGGTLDESLQWAHGVDLRGTSAELANVDISDVAGDCVHFNLSASRSSGSFHDSTCTDTGRSGVAVVAGDNVLVQGNTLGNIGFTVFNVEPNVGGLNGTSNVRINANTVNGRYRLYVYAVIANAPNVGQDFTNNRVVGSGLRIGIIPVSGTIVRPQDVSIIGNTADTATHSPAVEVRHVDGLNVTGNTIPMSGGAMALVDDSCSINVSGNVFPGGASEVTITNPCEG